MMRSPTESPSDYALRVIEAHLQDDAIVEGSRLPSERQLAEDLNISRRAVRCALDHLEQQGRIWRGVGRGTIVGARPPAIATPTIKELTNPTSLMEARLALEPSIAALAAIHATTEDMDNMQQILTRSARADNHTEWDRWDSALHEAIGKAAHNHVITALYDLLGSARNHTQWGQLRKASLNPDTQKLYTEQHTKILEAVLDRDASAATDAMRTHLRTVSRTLLDPWST